MVSTLKGCHYGLAPFQGAELFLIVSGGLRFAATTGYFLTALQADSSSSFLTHHHSSLFTFTLINLHLFDAAGLAAAAAQSNPIS